MHTTRESYYPEQIRNEAYFLKLDHLGKQQKKVFDIIQAFQPISNNGISEKTGIPVHVVSARVSELRGYEKNPVTGKREINPNKILVEFCCKNKKVKPPVSLWRTVAKQIEMEF